jgi:hypothetical protein
MSVRLFNLQLFKLLKANYLRFYWHKCMFGFKVHLKIERNNLNRVIRGNVSNQVHAVRSNAPCHIGVDNGNTEGAAQLPHHII